MKKQAVQKGLKKKGLKRIGREIIYITTML